MRFRLRFMLPNLPPVELEADLWPKWSICCEEWLWEWWPLAAEAEEVEVGSGSGTGWPWRRSRLRMFWNQTFTTRLLSCTFSLMRCSSWRDGSGFDA